jgi:hypothetical protein
LADNSGVLPVTRTERLMKLIGAATLLCVFFVPSASCGQTTATGTWSGTLSYSVQYLDEFGFPTGGYSGLDSTTLTIQLSPGSAVATTGDGLLDVLYSLSSFGPNSASGSYFDFLPQGFDYGSFDANYLSILPDGSIDTSGGFAVADRTYVYDFGSSGIEEVFSFQSFQSEGPALVPEPSAMVQMAIGVVVIALFAGIRARHASKSRACRRSPRRSFAAHPADPDVAVVGTSAC